jgi:LETM1 and EF-hand domain-containing protein 1
VGGPPPGFNINEAKKPLPKDQPEKPAQSTSQSVLKESDEQLKTHKSAPTAIDKTVARDNASLTELATDKNEHEKAMAAKKEESKKLTIGQKVMRELHHYWDGTKLLATEVKISTRLALKMAAGYDLSRRENRQVREILVFRHWDAMLTSRLSCNALYKILDDSSHFPSSS